MTCLARWALYFPFFLTHPVTMFQMAWNIFSLKSTFHLRDFIISNRWCCHKTHNLLTHLKKLHSVDPEQVVQKSQKRSFTLRLGSNLISYCEVRILFWWHPVLSNPLVSLQQFVFPITKLDLNCEPEAPPLSTESWDSFLSRRSCPSTTRRTSGLARQHREEPSKFRGRCSRNENHRYTEKRVSNWDHFSVENL